MEELKVGDNVRVIKNMSHGFDVGTIGTIRKPPKNWPGFPDWVRVWAKWEGRYMIFNHLRSDLEKIEQP